MLNDCIVSESIVSESSLTRQLANMGLLSHNQVVSVCLCLTHVYRHFGDKRTWQNIVRLVNLCQMMEN